MRIALIGYGEVGRIFGEDLAAAGHELAAYDVQLRTEACRSLAEHAAAHGVRLAKSHADAVRVAELVISAVTASQSVAAATACARALPEGSFFLDFNSVSPAAKLSGARQVSGWGGRYVEAAVMASVPPYRLRVPLLLGGPDATLLAPVLEYLGFASKVASSEFGVASATKMCRSVVVKGLEALLIESFTAARHYGVEDAVIASLMETFPGVDWEQQAAYFFQRVIEHGRRRGEEMREAAATVRDAGLEPWGATGTAARQSWTAELADAGLFGQLGTPGFAKSADWRTEADRILRRGTNIDEGAMR